MKPNERSVQASLPPPRDPKPQAPHSGEGAASAMDEMVKKRIEPRDQKQAPKPAR